MDKKFFAQVSGIGALAELNRRALYLFVAAERRSPVTSRVSCGAPTSKPRSRRRLAAAVSLPVDVRPDPDTTSDSMVLTTRSGARSCLWADYPGPRAALALLLLIAFLTSCSDSASSGQGDRSSPPVSTKARESTTNDTETRGDVPSATHPTASTPPSRPRQNRGLINRRLIDAAWANDVSRARQLIRRGADVNHQDATEQSAYLIAASEGYRKLLELTLRNGADVSSLDSFNGTGLIRAAERGHASIVGRLHQANIADDHVNNLGWTALLEAIILGDGSDEDVDTVRLLIAGGADVQLASARDGITPFDHARLKGHDDVATTLAAALRTGSVERPDASLLAAAASGDADRATMALRAGADLEARDDIGRTPLLLAVARDRLAVARLLIALGADPDALDDRHDTPWLVTGVTGSVDMLETLLPARPDLTIVNRFGGTSLIPASERGHVEYVRRVVTTRIDVNHVNDLGWTALLEAVILGDGSQPYQRIVRILLNAGANPSISDQNGTTPIEHARANGQVMVVSILRDA